MTLTCIVALLAELIESQYHNIMNQIPRDQQPVLKQLAFSDDDAASGGPGSDGEPAVAGEDAG